MDGSAPFSAILITCILFLLNFIIYGFSAAIQNISEQELDKISHKDQKMYSKICKIIDCPGKFITTVQSTTMIMTLIVGAFELNAVFSVMNKWSFTNFGKFIDSSILYAIMFLVTAYVLIFCILSLCIVLPKRLGSVHPYSYVVSLINISYIIMVIFTPITFIVTKITNVLLTIFGIDPKQPEENVTEEDIMSVVNEGHEQGVLLASEAEMITNIVEFGDKEAKDIMTHRKSISAVDADMSLEEATAYILSQNNSRFPAYIDDIDNVIGIINLRDIMVEFQKEINKNKKIKEIDNLIRKATFIPETRKINVLFKSMQSEKIHMAIVIDEYGQTSGIVAMEDILEEIVGNILDEYDEEENDIVKIDNHTYIVKGLTTLNDFSDVTGIEYDEEEYDTINGYLTSKFERILSNDERPEITIDGITYKILNVQNKLISTVQVIIPEPEINKEDAVEA